MSLRLNNKNNLMLFLRFCAHTLVCVSIDIDTSHTALQILIYEFLGINSRNYVCSVDWSTVTTQF